MNDLPGLDNTTNSEKFTRLVTMISDAADDSMPLKKPFSLPSPQPVWWDEECRDMSLLAAVLADLNCQTVIYTDGSKSEMGTGSAFYISSHDYCRGYRIPEFCSIFTAEAFAIHQALVWCLEHNITYATIISDSKSVLEAIKLNPTKFYNNNIISNIRTLLVACKAKRIKVNFVWVKGHAGIDGNAFVDTAAKNAVNSDAITEVTVFSDFFIEIKKSIRKRWEVVWSDFVSESHNHYTLLHPALPKENAAANVAEEVETGVVEEEAVQGVVDGAAVEDEGNVGHYASQNGIVRIQSPETPS
ncbi:unnamed protein product [Callosobruchus maculatus]|uniref:RNase H type-1 domain-containing protein n=1 Tax=Callosobruchus maculatus TaxID=64391 RepID=A0A653C8X5_CALMS|nr:unnamed protein product [Callosobruchus maculatus]